MATVAAHILMPRTPAEHGEAQSLYVVTEARHRAETLALLARHEAEREEADPTRFSDHYFDEWL